MSSLPSREELLERLDAASAKGSVTATKLLLEELRRDDDDAPESGFDALDNVADLASHRKASGA